MKHLMAKIAFEIGIVPSLKFKGNGEQKKCY